MEPYISIERVDLGFGDFALVALVFAVLLLASTNELQSQSRNNLKESRLNVLRTAVAVALVGIISALLGGVVAEASTIAIDGVLLGFLLMLILLWATVYRRETNVVGLHMLAEEFDVYYKDALLKVLESQGSEGASRPAIVAECTRLLDVGRIYELSSEFLKRSGTPIPGHWLAPLVEPLVLTDQRAATLLSQMEANGEIERVPDSDRFVLPEKKQSP